MKRRGFLKAIIGALVISPVFSRLLDSPDFSEQKTKVVWVITKPRYNTIDFSSSNGQIVYQISHQQMLEHRYMFECYFEDNNGSPVTSSMQVLDFEAPKRRIEKSDGMSFEEAVGRALEGTTFGETVLRDMSPLSQI